MHLLQAAYLTRELTAVPAHHVNRSNMAHHVNRSNMEGLVAYLHTKLLDNIHANCTGLTHAAHAKQLQEVNEEVMQHLLPPGYASRAMHLGLVHLGLCI